MAPAAARAPEPQQKQRSGVNKAKRRRTSAVGEPHTKAARTKKTQHFRERCSAGTHRCSFRTNLVRRGFSGPDYRGQRQWLILVKSRGPPGHANDANIQPVGSPQPRDQEETRPFVRPSSQTTRAMTRISTLRVPVDALNRCSEFSGPVCKSPISTSTSISAHVSLYTALTCI